jgi:RimJ/RimL family protein N-acetyltransferase
MAASTTAPTDEANIVTLECTRATYVPAPDPRVRWLDRETDFDLACEAWGAVGIPITRADWDDWRRQGYGYCGIVEDGRLVANAAAWTYSPTASEVAAVRTREGHRSQGYSTAVCSFVTAYILASGQTATFSMRADNTPMLRVAMRLGFQAPEP